VAEHVIETEDALPVKASARPIPFHVKDHVHTQLQEMADVGIIQPSNSSWCIPVVYVPKANDEIRICVDFVQGYKEGFVPSAKSRWTSTEVTTTTTILPILPPLLPILPLLHQDYHYYQYYYYNLYYH